MTDRIPFVAGISAIEPDYDGFVLDVWGVIHDGKSLYPGVVDTLRRLQRAGKPYVMLTNAPRRSDAVIESMVAMGMPSELCRSVVSSGEATWSELNDRSDPWYAGIGNRCLHIGPERDEGLFGGPNIEPVASPVEADFILNSGPWLDEETVEDYEDLLEYAAQRGLPMVCANPDLAVIRGGVRIICAGALAARYEALGARVRYLGKPHAAIYDHCFARLGIEDHTRIVAIGDSFRTDLAGAAAVGLDSVLVVGGIHGDELAAPNGGPPDEENIARVCRREGVRPVAAVAQFVW